MNVNQPQGSRRPLVMLGGVVMLASLVISGPAQARKNQKIDLHNLDDASVTLRVKNVYDDRSRTIASGQTERVIMGVTQNEVKTYRVYNGSTLVCKFDIWTNDYQRRIENISDCDKIRLKEDASDSNYIRDKRSYKKGNSTKIDRSLELYWLAQP